MTFTEAIRAAAEYGERYAETHESPPQRLPADLVGAFECDARVEALHGRAREAFWMHRYFSARTEARV